MKDKMIFGHSSALSIEIFSTVNDLANIMKESGLDVNQKYEGEHSSLTERSRIVSL